MDLRLISIAIKVGYFLFSVEKIHKIMFCNNQESDKLQARD